MKTQKMIGVVLVFCQIESVLLAETQFIGKALVAPICYGEGEVEMPSCLGRDLVNSTHPRDTGFMQIDFTSPLTSSLIVSLSK